MGNKHLKIDKQTASNLESFKEAENYIRYGELKNGSNILDEYQEFKKELDKKEKKRENRRKMNIILSYVIVFGAVIILAFLIHREFFASYERDPRIDENSIHYVNDIYYSDGYFYENYLDEIQKEVYKTWLSSLRDKMDEIVITLPPVDEKNPRPSNWFNQIATCLRLDHPEIFYLNFFIANTNGDTLKITNKYTTNKILIDLEERRMVRIVDRLTKKWEDLTESEKEKAVYEWLGKNVKYKQSIDLPKDKTSHGALIGKKANSEGISKAAQLLLVRLGLDSRVAIGNLEGNVYHWNIVTINDINNWFDASIAASTKNKEAPRFNEGLNIKDTSKYTLSFYELPFKKKEETLPAIKE